MRAAQAGPTAMESKTIKQGTSSLLALLMRPVREDPELVPDKIEAQRECRTH